MCIYFWHLSAAPIVSNVIAAYSITTRMSHGDNDVLCCLLLFGVCINCSVSMRIIVCFGIGGRISCGQTNLLMLCCFPIATAIQLEIAQRIYRHHGCGKILFSTTTRIASFRCNCQLSACDCSGLSWGW